MKHRNVVKAAVRNAYAIEWAKTHTLQDLEDLVNEMSDLGEDVSDISRLLFDLHELDRSLGTDEMIAIPETSEQAEIAG